MNEKKWVKISFYSLLFGWFPFMWICGWGMWQPWEIKLAIMLMGLFLCITSSLLFQPILKNEDLFKSIEELEKEKENYHRAVQRLEKKIREL